jgi:NAD(P)-dependent dehydrogenase (short-subunit alcohol dehydrogenase family)
VKELKERTAVVTGAASGIGRGLAFQLAREGMSLVLADVEHAALQATEREIQALGTPVLAVPTDVSRLADVQNLALQAEERFGHVHLLCNCAGVAVTGAIWEHPPEDWTWLLGVNVWGVIHAIHVFVPRMLAQSTPAHVVNTASVSGLTSNMGSIYTMTKHAVVALTESLYHQLRMREAKIGVTLLCPGPVDTRIVDSDRNRPPHLRSDYTDASRNPAYRRIKEDARPRLANGLSPQAVAEAVVDAVRQDRFYVITHPHYKKDIERRMIDLLSDRNPTPVETPAGLGKKF